MVIITLSIIAVINSLMISGLKRQWGYKYNF